MQQSVALAAGALAVLAGPALALDLPEGTDPVFAEAFNACLDGASGGVPPEERGWQTHMSGDPDAQAWDNWTGSFATNDIDGVGGMNLSATIEDYPGYELGTCVVTIDEPKRDIAAPALKSAPGFTGTLQGDAADWSGTWRNDDATLFVRAGMSSNAERFRLSIVQFTATP